MSNVGQRALQQGPGDGSLWKTALQDLNTDLTALFNWNSNKVTANGVLGAGTTVGTVKSTATMGYLLNGSGYQLAATDNKWNLTALTTAANGFAKVLLQLDSAGVASVVKGVESTVSQAAAKFPTPTANTTVIGWVQLGNSYAGGAIATTSIFDGTPLPPTQLTSFADTQ